MTTPPIDLVERLRDKTRLRKMHGLSGWVLAEEHLLSRAAKEIERLRAAIAAHEAQRPMLWISNWHYEALGGGKGCQGSMMVWVDPSDKTGLVPLYTKETP